MKNPYLTGAFTALSLVVAQNATAQSVESFYKGKNVTMLIGSGAGGGYDTYSRVLAKHMGRHIPGNPHIVP
jgi:tripartite-type tricarboxylate transporter receptor subunit TctC